MKKTRATILVSVAMVGLGPCGAFGAEPVGTAFTYQGQFDDDGAPVDGVCEFEFSLWDADTDGLQIGDYVAGSDVPVADGRFTVTLDFGVNAFAGEGRWLEIEALCLDDENYTLLGPRQQLTPVPEATQAETAGSFMLQEYWRLRGNPTYAGDFLGTTNDSNLELRVGNKRALLIEHTGLHASPNLIGGYLENKVDDAVGATIAGGGGWGGYHSVTDDYGTVSGGHFNTASGRYSTVPGGQGNTAAGDWSVAAGRRAKANHDGALVWADSTNADFASTSPDEFRVRATGGVEFVVDVTTDGGGLRIEPTGTTPNLIGGSTCNWVESGVLAATIGGGGTCSFPNRVTDHYGTVSGGYDNIASGRGATVGGGFGNTARHGDDTVGGGSENTASFGGATVAGGCYNTANGGYSTVGGGLRNIADGTQSTVGGGLFNEASGQFAVIPGGEDNIAEGKYSTVGGGYYNRAYGWAAVIPGGVSNTAESNFSAIGGGFLNHVTTNGYAAVIPGGRHNIAEGHYSAIGGGHQNHVTTNGYAAVIPGGEDNTAEGDYSAIGGGLYNHVTTNGFAAVIPGGEDNTAEGDFSFAAGRHAKANHDGAFVWADSTDADFASTANDQFLARATGGVLFDVGGGSQLRIESDPLSSNVIVRPTNGMHFDVGSGHGQRIELGPNSESANIIGGHSDNSVDPSVEGATIAGGGFSSWPHAITADTHFGTVSGGLGNTVSGGAGTVGGGGGNTASGACSTVPGGYGNTAQGDYSLAAGRRANILAEHDGAFLFADSNDLDFDSAAANEFAVRCVGGVRFVLAVTTNGAPATGVKVAPGSGAWASMSDRNAKDNFQAVDGRKVLDRLAGVPVATWNYKSQDSSVRHLGPVAQDFYAAFGVGDDDKHISTVDADGVALAAIQGLYDIVQEKDEQIVAQQEEISALHDRLVALESLVTDLAAAGNGGVR